jgi:signal peptidase
MRHIRLATLLALTATLTLAWVAATPSTAIPVGLADTGGISMGEEQANDVVLYVDQGEPEIGQQVVYYAESEQTYIRHRVVNETEQGYVTQGDALPKTDAEYWGEYVTQENYVGTVVLRL